jgi:hypothetical protein
MSMWTGDAAWMVFRIRHTLSRPIAVSADGLGQWVVLCSCGGWSSEPTGSLKQLKQAGTAHVHAALETRVITSQPAVAAL